MGDPEVLKTDDEGNPTVIGEQPSTVVENKTEAQTIESAHETPRADTDPEVEGGYIRLAGPCGASMFPHDSPEERRDKTLALGEKRSFLHPRECPTCGIFREAHEFTRGQCAVAIEYGLAKQPAAVTK